ncbi:MAG: SGNH/GDSL hydrolase family protein [Evtepia sp.]
MLEKTSHYFSVLGDSLTSFAGISPMEGAFYAPAVYGLSTYCDTWWMQVICKCGGSLLANNSYSGSTVSRHGYLPASFPNRIRRLAKPPLIPDVILVSIGLNDVAQLVPPKEFGVDYGLMLSNLHAAYPRAELFCSTLCHAVQREKTRPLFVNFSECISLSLYNEQIRSAARSVPCRLIELSNVTYSSPDGVHPDRQGMRELAEAYLSAMDD